jgi:two-component system chemotaxis sensor kinase CheA
MSDSYSIFLTEFLSSAEELVARLAAELEGLRSDPEGGRDLTPLLRGFHSLKGNSSFVPDCPMTPLAHAAEDAIEAARDGFVAPVRLLDPLTAALDCFVMRIEEYRRAGGPAPVTPREQEIVAVLCKLAAADGERAGISSRYFFAGEDVTEALALIHQAELGGVDPSRLRALHDRIRDLAAASGASGGAEFEQDREPDPRALMRWLAERAVRVPVAKGKTPLLARGGRGWEAARGALLPQHFTVDAEIVDEFLEHAVELRLFSERLARLDRKLREIVDMPAELPARAGRRGQLDQLAAELRAANHAFIPLAARLQERLLAIRRVPVKRLLDRHAAMIRDLAPRLGKEVAVVVVGGSTRVDKSIVEQLEPSLTHMVRNAVDHGLETPPERAAQNKPARGSMTLHAKSEGQWLVLEVGDDGAGIDAAALRRSAVERGFLDGATAAGMSDEQVIHLVFLPGLSSRREVSELSGRGVGMDEVFATVRQLRGTIRVDSVRGQGTKFVIKVPDTGFAVVRCVPARVGELRFLIPHDATRRWSDTGIDPERDGPLIELADVAPHLEADWLRRARTPPAAAGHPSGGGRLIVVLESGGRRLGLHVDEVGREMDVVVRPLDRELVRAPLWSMAALGEEGETRLVLDVEGLAALLPAARARLLPPAMPDAA